MARIQAVVLAAGATALLGAVMVWRLPQAAVVAPGAGSGDAAVPAPSPVAAPAPTVAARVPTAPPGWPDRAAKAQGRLVRERDGQLYEDFPDGRRVLRTTVRMRDAAGREWDEPVEVEAAPVDPRQRDAPRAR